ncbi:hypothetical protein, partial [Streptomyces sp. 8P21H-1]|uniref:hypothetical protein n=1 Tax=Streptomyces sp. 8P21H-1 TaxID=2737048 RepID=UPI00157116BD
ADTAGTPVAAVGSLVTRPISAGQLGGAGGPGRDSLFTLDWVSVDDDPARTDGATGPVTVIGPDDALLGGIGAGRVLPDLTGLVDAVAGDAAGDANAEGVPSVVLLPVGTAPAAQPGTEDRP